VRKLRGLELYVSGHARRDIAAVLKWSLQKFGEAASLRYEALILQALVDIEADPERQGSKARPELMVGGARTYHLWFSRSRVSGLGVEEPRHFVLYRRREGGGIEVARLLHDSRDLQRHLPESYRRMEPRK
jgi:toxin ParE1/3/4